ncbi:MAG: hypothetical protein PVH68_20435 [Armatimonadota bacterium]|jgi:cell division protein FtsW (lipid II flippase)
MQVWHVPLIFAVLAALFICVALALATALGWPPLSMVGIALLLAGVLLAAVLTWPVAWVLTVITEWVRPEERASSGSYSIDQGREVDEKRRSGQ